MVDATFVLNLVETVGILVGVAIAIMEIRKSREERNDQVTDQFMQYRYSNEFVKNWVSFLLNSDFSTYEEWSEKYSPYVNPEVYIHFLSLLSFFNAVVQRLIDGSMNLEQTPPGLLDVMVIAVYERSLPIIEE